MKTKTKRDLLIATSCMIAFTIWTVLVCLVDVRAIGPLDSKIGFATLNGDFHRLIGVHLFWYTLTDALSILPLCIVIGFGMLGLCQWIKRRDIRSVDLDILILGFFYIAVFTMFLAFEKLCITITAPF